MLGSAQVLIEQAGQRVVVTGDYKRLPDRTSQPYELVECDLLVTEATFGLPVFQHPHPKLEIGAVAEIGGGPAGALPHGGLLCAGQGAAGDRAVARCRVGCADISAWRDDPAVRAVSGAGRELGELIPATGMPKAEMAGQIVIAPPSAIRDRWSRRFPDPVVCQASGWMSVKQRARQALVELPLVISDHCDWGELQQTIRETKARDRVGDAWARGCAGLLVPAQGLQAEPLNIQGFEDDGGEGAEE